MGGGYLFTVMDDVPDSTNLLTNILGGIQQEVDPILQFPSRPPFS
jgi:hypothetical protein